MAFELQDFRNSISLDTLQLPNHPETKTLDELCGEVQQNNECICATTPNQSSTMAEVPEPTSFTTRSTLPENICSIAICPAYPKFMIVGTYSLADARDPDRPSGQVRGGSVHVLPVAATFKPAYPGALPPLLDSRQLYAAVLDVQFHDKDNTLFGVASSGAKMSFYRLIKSANVHGRRIETRIMHLGNQRVTDDGDDGTTPLITSFTWLPGFAISENEGAVAKHVFSIAFTTSSNKVTVLKAAVAALRSEADLRSAVYGFEILERIELQSHGQEAWHINYIIACASMGNEKDDRHPTTYQNEKEKLLVLSGGDDSALIASIVTPSPTILETSEPPESLCLSDPHEQEAEVISTMEPRHLWTDRKTHQAGVTATLPLAPIAIPMTSQSMLPLLTGSYDGKIRLILLEPGAKKRHLVVERDLGGGVWRLLTMKETTRATLTGESYTALILASCMHRGAKIIKITHGADGGDDGDDDDDEGENIKTGWKIQEKMVFFKGHKSMVYSCGFVEEEEEDGVYTIVSTSFYDKAVCTWTYVDDEEVAGKTLGHKSSWIMV